jgi:ubiquinone/menaquinone biosynthesis C-methylase UbiE
MATDPQTWWDAQAATFDQAPDHGLRADEVRTAWADLLLPHLPGTPACVVDLGCGTGSLSVLLAGAGHRVHGLDLSHQMVRRARSKAASAGAAAAFVQGDASRPPYPEGFADAVLVRHVLWALPDKETAVARWVHLLGPDGVLLLVEGQWWTGEGLSAAQCERIVRHHRESTQTTVLTDPALWGTPVTDERYLLVSRG